MRKTINYELTYFKKGQELKRLLKISFVSNRIYDWYSDIVDRTNKLQVAIEKRKETIQDMILEAVNSDLSIIERRKKTKPYREKLKQLEKEIKETDSKDFVSARHKLISRILEDNGIEPDDEIMSVDFWNDCVEPSEMWAFLVAVVTKDSEPKKKVVTQN